MAYTRALEYWLTQLSRRHSLAGLAPQGASCAAPTCTGRLPGFARAVALVSCQRLHPQGEISVAQNIL
eukprot:365478-Chlamydomonas_euryale.AAC.5